MSDSVAITGLRYDRVPGSDSGSQRLFVLAATTSPTRWCMCWNWSRLDPPFEAVCVGCRCYQFIGGPTFTDLFSSMKNLYYNEIRGGSTVLCLFIVALSTVHGFGVGMHRGRADGADGHLRTAGASYWRVYWWGSVLCSFGCFVTPLM